MIRAKGKFYCAAGCGQSISFFDVSERAFSTKKRLPAPTTRSLPAMKVFDLPNFFFVSVPWLDFACDRSEVREFYFPAWFEAF